MRRDRKPLFFVFLALESAGVGLVNFLGCILKARHSSPVLLSRSEGIAAGARNLSECSSVFASVRE